MFDKNKVYNFKKKRYKKDHLKINEKREKDRKEREKGVDS